MMGFSYVAPNGSEWEVALEPPLVGPWYVIEATPNGGGLPIIGRFVEENDGPLAIARLIESINSYSGGVG